jgi:hypothetical protein
MVESDDVLRLNRFIRWDARMVYRSYRDAHPEAKAVPAELVDEMEKEVWGNLAGEAWENCRLDAEVDKFRRAVAKFVKGEGFDSEISLRLYDCLKYQRVANFHTDPYKGEDRPVSNLPVRCNEEGEA